MQRIVDGLTYNQNTLHCVINYTILIASLSEGCLPILLIFTTLQVIIWFTTNRPGISLIWCGLMGYHLIDPNIFLVFPFSGILYYAVTLPLITTVAHIIAVILGYYITTVVIHYNIMMII